MTALIWLPDETVTYQASGAPAGSQRFQADPGAAGYPPADAAVGAASARAPAVAALGPRFSADGPDTREGQPESTGELADDGEAVPSPRARATGTTNGPGAAQSASGGTDQADQDQWDDVRARSDSEARSGLGPRAGSRAQDSQAEAIAPPAMSTAENRLPIFESVESDWFRRGKHEAISAMSDQVPGHRTAEAADGWRSAADEGWRAAEALKSPSAAGLTPAGLPRRVPQANLVPGGVAEPSGADQPEPVRSASATRQLMASFQRGSREGRAALRGNRAPGTGSEEDA
jgi:hypothetical protein